MTDWQLWWRVVRVNLGIPAVMLVVAGLWLALLVWRARKDDVTSPESAGKLEVYLSCDNIEVGEVVTARGGRLYSSLVHLDPLGVAARDIERGELLSFDPGGNTADILTVCTSLVSDA